MVENLKEAFKLENLRRSWKWLNTNSEGQFKNYFRNIYRAYAIAEEDNLHDLRKRLLNSSYRPTHATKLYFPKKSGIQRTFSLLTVEDQIVYQALVAVIAERLLPAMRKHHLITVFGNIYGGRRSRFFYKDWRVVYRGFSQSIRSAYTDGFVYAASFDLTACYDSIDHSVLRHFLEELQLEKEFIDFLIDCLRQWSVTDSKNEIRQGHGIPQGPLSSGLLAEVVLSHFDNKRPKQQKTWRYFRYVDDIRILAKNERSLRRMLVAMDLLSKQIGLFPQSTKIGIHKIENIETEIKSVFYPPETAALRVAPNQDSIVSRLKELSPKLKVIDETRFKFVLGSAQPSQKISARLLKILSKHPHLYRAIFAYFEKSKKFQAKLSARMLNVIRSEDLYPSLVASGLRVLLTRCHGAVQSDLSSLCEALLQSPNTNDPELIAAATAVALTQHRLTHDEMLKYIFWKRDWWTRAEVARYIQPNQIGRPSFEAIVNKLLEDDVTDVSLMAVELLIEHELNLTVATENVNYVAQLALKKAEIIGKRQGGQCPISRDMQDMFGTEIKGIAWKQILGKHYKPSIPKVGRIRASSTTDPSSWVNLLDTLHDDLLDSLYTHDPILGTYQHGKIGSVLNNPKNALAMNYPFTCRAFHEIHSTRLNSDLSHSIVHTTQRRTRAIPFSYIRSHKIKRVLIQAYLEIAAKW